MPRLRRNLSTLAEWDPVILDYARAVALMQDRPLLSPSSWRWQAAVHGFHDGLLEPGEDPDPALVEDFWNQCQHGSWYFLPWHRGYLSAFEAIVRDAVLETGGSEDWALPYWDLGRPEWQRLRPEFCTPELPDGGRNALFVEARRPGFETGDVGIDPRSVALDRILVEPEFGGDSRGGSTGFGGPETGFFHGPGATGALEGGIHNYVHGRVGGPGGYMSSFEEAGLDPVFWLHHCNVDRLWEVWRGRDARHLDPDAAGWRTGPLGRPFRLYRSDDELWTFTSEEMVDTRAEPLGYEYEDVGDPLGGTPPPTHLRGFGARARRRGMGVAAMVGRGRRIDVLGAIAPGVSLGGGRRTARIGLAPPPTARSRKSLAGAAPSAERYLLNLENITGVDPGQAYRVYVNLPDDGDPDTEERHLVGTMSLFGVARASDPDGEHSGNGLSYVFDVTELVGRRPDGTRDAEALTVDFVSDDDGLRDDAANVGRISIVRER